jgi:hypothetical protein
MGRENTGKRKRGQTKRKAFNQPSMNPPRGLGFEHGLASEPDETLFIFW